MVSDTTDEPWHVSVEIGVPYSFAAHRRLGYPRNSTEKDAENYFQVNVFYSIFDFVIDGLFYVTLLLL